MKIEDIESEWSKDAKISETNLGGEALKIPRLHSKWYSMMLNEKKILYSISIRKEELAIILEAYFAKTLTMEELKQHDLPPSSDKKILRQDIPKHIANYPAMVTLNLKIALQSDKIEFMKDILKHIHGRSFIIKDAIAWAQFSNGSY
jgi:hypothetical protein